MKYFEMLGVENEIEAFDIVKQHCFLQNDVPTNGQVKHMLAVCIANSIDPRMGEIYDEYENDDFTSNVSPTLRIRGWYRIADSSKRIKGVEFVYSDTMFDVGTGRQCSAWIECHVYIDDNDRPITSRVYGQERIQFGGAWLEMPNTRLEQSVYVAAMGRALGTKGLYDTDTIALAKAERIGRSNSSEESAPGSAKSPNSDNSTTPTTHHQWEEMEHSEHSEQPQSHIVAVYDSNEASQEEEYFGDTEINHSVDDLNALMEEVNREHELVNNYNPSMKDKSIAKTFIANCQATGAWQATIEYIKKQQYSPAQEGWILLQIEQVSIAA